MSNKNNIDKILNSSNELDEYEISEESTKDEYEKHSTPRSVEEFEDVFEVDENKSNISEVKVEEEDYGYLDDNDEDEEPEVVPQSVPSNQKITITRIRNFKYLTFVELIDFILKEIQYKEYLAEEVAFVGD